MLKFCIILFVFLVLGTNIIHAQPEESGEYVSDEIYIEPYVEEKSTYDLLKSNPRLAKAREQLRTRNFEDNTSESSIQFNNQNKPDGDNTGLLILGIILAIIALIHVWKEWNQSILSFVNTKFGHDRKTSISFLIICGLVILKACIDIFVAFYNDSALNMLMAFCVMAGLYLCVQHGSKIWGYATVAIIMGLRVILNLILTSEIINTSLLQFFIQMPLAALPNFIMAYAIPSIIFVYMSAQVMNIIKQR